ncbi:MAG TPA: S41 family peptidase [Ignavibacteriales bacterium]|nr:S41 family peptidase [Ignavibacteriales bacterium]
MKRVLIVSVLLFCVPGFLSARTRFGSQPAESDSSLTWKSYSPSALQYDLDVLLKTSVDVHPYFYRAVDSVTFSREFMAVRNKLTTHMSRLEFYQLVAPLFSIFKNGHTSVAFPTQDWNSFINHGGRYFSYRIIYDNDNGMTVADSRDSSKVLPVGTKIIKINGYPADSLFNAFRRYRGGERENWRNNIISSSFSLYLWLNNITAPYEITYIEKSTDKEETLKTSGAVSSPVKESNSQISINEAPYSYEILPENIGLFNYKSMYSDKANPFGGFLKKLFTDLKGRSSRGLIIDLRKNGGGNTAYGIMLLNYLTDKPYKISSKKLWKSSAQMKSYIRNTLPWPMSWLTYRPFIWIAGMFRDEAKMFTANDGEVVELNFEEEKPVTDSLLFTGKVCFLIGSSTFSSAMALANAVGDYKLATLIGEETGGIPNEYGEIYYFNLPKTGLQVLMPSALFVRANGDSGDRRGILPDIEVKQKPEDTSNMKDTVLEAAKNWILQKQEEIKH